MKRMACVLALAAGTGVAFGAAPQAALAHPAPAAASGLQVEIGALGAISNDGTVNLDVKYDSGLLRSIELYVDGTLIKEQSIRTRAGHGTLRFVIDSALLSNGTHEVKVIATDLDGNTATATSRVSLSLTPQSGPLRFVYPRSREMVQGVVPIEVKLDENLNKPYVMFFVDNDFLALINFPPYTYNWDSTRVPNGIHTLGVEAYDGDTLAKVKAHSLQIRVNNPGGFTHRQNDTPDLSRPGKKAVHPPTVALPTARPPAATGLPNALLEVKGNGAGLSLGARDPLGDLNTRHAGQPRGTYSTRSLPHIANIHRDRPVMAPNTGPSHTPVSAQPFSLTVRSIKPALKALLAGPDDLAGLHVAAPGASLAHQSVRPLRAGNIAVRPSTGLRPAVAAAPTAPRKAVAVTPRSPKAQIGIGSLLNIPGGTFEVAFDDTRIAFDVPPRVEHGLPLAPFRQIFEHTGGKVSWFSKAKLVRAVNDTREIEIKIGNAKAKVNNQTVQMEARPYIDRGRTIVPLSFIRDALDVNVQYDPQTGRMLIERK